MAQAQDKEAPTAPQDAPQAQPAPPKTATLPSNVGPLPYEVYRAQTAVADVVEGRALEMDKTVPGGKYVAADGTFVDADGKPLKGEKE